MNMFDDMKYVSGFDGENPRFSIPLQADEDGLLGRECPADGCTPKYFKITVAAEDDADAPSLTDAPITCPYCGHGDTFQEFHTQAQIDWATDLVMREVEEATVRSLQEAVRPLNNMRGPLRITAKVTANLPPIREYVEDKLKRQARCEQCGLQYAVYGVSYHCPMCGGGALNVHLRDSAATIRVLAAEAEGIGQKCGQDAQDKMLGNAYEDAVTLFEGFLKLIYRYGVRKQLPPQDAERLGRKIGTAFQRLDDAALLLQRDLAVELFQGVSQPDRDRMAIVFCKRHALTHNLGLVDEKYRDKVQAWEKPGQEVPVSAKEIAWAIDLIEQRLTAAAKTVGV